MLPDRPETRPGEPEIRSGRPGGVGVATWGTPDRELPAAPRVCVFRVFCEVPIGRPVERKSAEPVLPKWRRAGVFFCPVGGAATATSASEKRISAVGRIRFMAPVFGYDFSLFQPKGSNRSLQCNLKRRGNRVASNGNQRRYSVTRRGGVRCEVMPTHVAAFFNQPYTDRQRPPHFSYRTPIFRFRCASSCSLRPRDTCPHLVVAAMYATVDRCGSLP